MKRGISFFVALGLLFFCSIVFAEMKPDADLDNFRGIKWGTEKKYFSEKEYKKVDGKGIFYEKKNEKNNFMGFRTKEIYYGVDDPGGFQLVRIQYFFEESSKIVDKCHSYFGPGGKLTKSSSGDRANVEWVGKKIRAKLEICNNSCFGQGKDPTIYLSIQDNESLKKMLKEIKKGK